MYGRLLAARIPYRRWYDKPPFIATSDDFGVIDEKALDLVQDAYTCCSDQLPDNGKAGSLWICNICERIWGIPEEGGQSWTLTKFRIVDSPRKAYLAYHLHRWWVSSIAFGVATLALMLLAFVVMLGIDPSKAVYVSVAVYGLGIFITTLAVYRWRKLLNQYNFSISDS